MATKVWKGTDGSTPTAFDTAANWSPSGVPNNGDVLVFDHTASSNLAASLNQSTLTCTAIIEQGFTKNIGDGTSYLQLAASAITIGSASGFGSPSGSPRIMLDLGSTTCTVNVINSSSSATDTYYPPIQPKGTDLTVNVSGGKVGVAVRPGEASTGTFRTTKGANTDPTLYLGTGITPTAITVGAGTVTNRSSNTTTAATVTNGTYDYQGTGAHTALNVDGGTCYYSGTGTITAGRVKGILDFSRDPSSKTITNLDIHKGGTLNLDNGVAGAIAMTNPIRLVGCSTEDVTIKTPDHVDISITAI